MGLLPRMVAGCEITRSRASTPGCWRMPPERIPDLTPTLRSNTQASWMFSRAPIILATQGLSCCSHSLKCFCRGKRRACSFTSFLPGLFLDQPMEDSAAALSVHFPEVTSRALLTLPVLPPTCFLSLQQTVSSMTVRTALCSHDSFRG